MTSAKKILITGATSGLGEYVAKQVARDHQLLILARDAGKSRQLFPEAYSYVADLSDLSAVKSAATAIAHEHEHIDVLVCNAGMLGRERFSRTDENIEETLAVNYLSHYILLSKLWSNLRNSTSKVIIIGSAASAWYTIDFSDPGSKHDYKPLKAYGRSKAMLMMLGQWIDTEFSASGPAVFIVDPGTFRSGIARSRAGWFQQLYRLASWAMKPLDVAARDVLDIINGINYPAGKVIRSGIVKDLTFSNEEISNLLQLSSGLTGCKIALEH